MTFVKGLALLVFELASFWLLIEGCERFHHECKRRFGIKLITKTAFAYWGLASILMWFSGFFESKSSFPSSPNAFLSFEISVGMIIVAVAYNLLRTNILFGVAGSLIIGSLGMTFGPFLILFFLGLPFTAGNIKFDSRDRDCTDKNDYFNSIK